MLQSIENILDLTFNDGVNSKFEITKLASEFLDSENLLNTVKPIAMGFLFN